MVQQHGLVVRPQRCGMVVQVRFRGADRVARCIRLLHSMATVVLCGGTRCSAFSRRFDGPVSGR
jgi:hypothetical protein